jgi:hypothetical protein
MFYLNSPVSIEQHPWFATFCNKERMFVFGFVCVLALFDELRIYDNDL